MSSHEPGVICVIRMPHASKNNGGLVELVKFLGAIEGSTPTYPGNDWWQVQPLSFVYGTNTKKWYSPNDKEPLGVRQCNLIPLGDPLSGVSEEEVKLLYTPTKFVYTSKIKE